MKVWYESQQQQQQQEKWWTKIIIKIIIIKTRDPQKDETEKRTSLFNIFNIGRRWKYFDFCKQNEKCKETKHKHRSKIIMGKQPKM